MPPITLNDFRSLLGSQNDGNVVFSQNQAGEITGIKKVNYGWNKKESTPNDIAVNRAVRDAFINAISNSPEGRAAGAEAIKQIGNLLGASQVKTYDKPLGRRDIKNVLTYLDGQSGGARQLIANESSTLQQLGLLDAQLSLAVHDKLKDGNPTCMEVFRNAKSMMETFGQQEGFGGFTHAQLEHFVKDNADRIKLLTFDRLYFAERDYRQLRETDPKSVQRHSPLEMSDGRDYQIGLLKGAITSLMATYARHEEIVTQAQLLISAGDVPKTSPLDELLKPTVARFNSLVDFVFPTVSDSVYENFQNHAVADAVKAVFSNACQASFAGQNAEGRVDRFNGAIADLRMKKPAFVKMMDAAVELLQGLSPSEKMAVAANFRDTVLTALRTTAAGSHYVTPEQIAEILGNTVENFLKDAASAKLIETFVTQVATETFNVPADKVPALLTELKPSLEGEPSLAALRQLVASNRANGRTGSAALGDKPAYAEFLAVITAKIRENVEGPQKREEIFLEIGRSPNVYQKVHTSLRVKDEQGEMHARSEALTLIGGKIAFLLTIMGKAGKEEFTALMEANGSVEHFECHGDVEHFTEEDFNDPTRWPARDQEFIRKLDALCARYSIADLNDTATYYKTGVANGDHNEALYLLGRDKRFNMAEASNEGAQVINTAIELGVSNTLYFINTTEDSTVKGDLRNFYDTLAAMLNPMQKKPLPPFPQGDVEKVGTFLESVRDKIMRAERNDKSPFAAIKGMSMPEVIALMGDFGLKIKDLATTDGMARFLVMLRAKFVAGGLSEGLAAWVDRLTGFDVKKLPASDLPKVMAAIQSVADSADTKNPIKDPLTKFSVEKLEVAHFLQGRVKGDEFKLDSATMGAFVNALRSMKDGAATAACSIRGVEVVLKTGRDGVLEATVADGTSGRPLPIVMNRRAVDLLAVLETKIANAPDTYVALADGILPVLENGVPKGMTVSRTRELCTKILVAKFHVPSVTFASMDLAAIHSAAKGALDGSFTAANLPQEISNAYNSADIVAVQKAYEDSTEVERALVKMPTDFTIRSRQQRENEPPPPESVHRCLGELVMNLDTSVYDRDAVKSAGTRLQNVLVAWAPELKFILKDEASVRAAVDVLPEEVRAGVAEILNALRDVQANDLLQVAAVEAKIKAFVDTTMNAMQAQIAALFNVPVEAENTDAPWKKALEEMTNVNGLDRHSPNGKFVLDVLKNYFAKAAETEKRAMLAAYLRNARAGFTIGQQAGELMKGAGPIFQKMLQGLPIESFGPETQSALKDMKSRLASIPDPIVRAQLLDLIKSSNGQVMSIDVKRTIGCATVGQALLCHIVTKEHPYSGEDVVIKLRRPNVETAALRERQVIGEIARESGGQEMVDTFEGQFTSILKELDFTLEAENVDVGRTHYDRPADASGAPVSDVRSMGRFTAAPATMGSLILEKVSGDTLDGLMSDSAETVNAFRNKFEKHLALDPNGGEVHTVYQTDDIGQVGSTRSALRNEYRKMTLERRTLEHLVKVWTDEVLFGKGFFHGDLHAGNVMVNLGASQNKLKDDASITFIDFGNATRLSPAEQKQITKLFVVAGYSFNNTNPGHEFVEALLPLLDEGARTALADNGNVRNALEGEINDVMRMGQADKLVAKVIAALAAVQRNRIPLPGGLGSFLQSMTRLKGAMSQLDNQIELCETIMHRLAFGPTAVSKLGLGQFDGKLPMIADMKVFLSQADKCFVDDGQHVPLFDDYRTKAAKFDSLQRNVKTMAEADGIEFDGVTYRLFGESGNDTKIFRDFASAFKGILFKLSKAEASELEGVEKTLDRCDKLDKLYGVEPLDEATALKLKKDLLQYLADFHISVCNALNVKVPKHEQFDSFEEIMGDCVSKRTNDIQAMFDYNTQLNFAYGSLMIDPKIMAQRQKADKAAREANSQLPENERVDALRRDQLEEIARSFRLPDGPVGITDLEPAKLKEVLEVNMGAIRQRLGYAEGEPIASGELKYLATWFKTIRQVEDDRGTLKRGFAMAGALVQILAGMFDDNFKILDVYELKQDKDIPMVRATKKLTNETLDSLALSADARRFADLLRA